MASGGMDGDGMRIFDQRPCCLCRPAGLSGDAADSPPPRLSPPEDNGRGITRGFRAVSVVCRAVVLCRRSPRSKGVGLHGIRPGRGTRVGHHHQEPVWLTVLLFWRSRRRTSPLDLAARLVVAAGALACFEHPSKGDVAGVVRLDAVYVCRVFADTGKTR